MKFLITIITIIFSTNSFAEMTGNEIHELWQSNNQYSIGEANDYILGVIGTISHFQQLEWQGAEIEKRKPTYFLHVCFPEKVILKQPVDIVKNYIKNHPEFRNKPAIELAHESLLEVWGCKK